MTELASVGGTYGLTRNNFILDPETDTACFARRDIHTTEIAESLDVDLVTGLAPKRLVWGLYGGGKTHTLMRTMKELSLLTNIHVVRIECPDLGKKSRFHDLYREGIMRELGQAFVIDLIESAVGTVGFARRKEMLRKAKQVFGGEELANAAIRVVDPNFDEMRLWRWIAGVSLPRSDLDDLGQTQDLTQAEAVRLADIVITLGRLLRELKEKTLVLVLDEMERLASIGPDTVTTFVSGFTRLVDPNQKYVCVLIGASAGSESDLVEVFGPHGPVASRLGGEAKIEIPSLEDEDVDVFITGVIQYLRATDADLSLLLEKGAAATEEEVQENFFPFTSNAIAALKSRLSQIMTPREITIMMTRALGRAYRAQSPVVTTAHLV